MCTANTQTELQPDKTQPYNTSNHTGVHNKQRDPGVDDSHYCCCFQWNEGKKEDRRGYCGLRENGGPAGKTISAGRLRSISIMHLGA